MILTRAKQHHAAYETVSLTSSPAQMIFSETQRAVDPGNQG